MDSAGPGGPRWASTACRCRSGRRARPPTKSRVRRARRGRKQEPAGQPASAVTERGRRGDDVHRAGAHLAYTDAGPKGRQAGVFRRSAQSVCRGRRRRSSCVDRRRRQIRADLPLPQPVRPAWRAETHGRRTLCVLFLARRLGEQFDLWTLRVTAEVRAEINSRNIALSKDGKYVRRRHYLPNTLVILSAADLGMMKIFDVADRNGRKSRLSAVYQAPLRNSPSSPP